MAGKNMNYFLMDSTPNGRIKCTLANSTGVAYKIPMFVTGASSNGYTAWKTADGKTLKDVETSEADEL